MSTVILACKTLEQELLSAMEQEQCTYPVIWLESGLHNWPDKLRTRIQELLDGCGEYDTVLLAMSLCGNCVMGLNSRNFQLVIPRCSDCITLLLGSAQRQQQKATYFLTEGWLTGERNIYFEYKKCLERYGEKRAKRVFSRMLEHYRYLALVDTGCFDRAAAEVQVRAIALELGLEYRELTGSLDYLRSLLRGSWEERDFLIIPPNSVVTDSPYQTERSQL